MNDNIAETATERKTFIADFTSHNIAFKRIDVDISATTKKLATIRYYQLLNGTTTELLKSAKMFIFIILQLMVQNPLDIMKTIVP